MLVVAVTTEKGGNAKTTTAVHLAHVVAKSGHRVLLIDADQNAHVALSLGIPESEGAYKLFDPLGGDTKEDVMGLVRSSDRMARPIREENGETIHAVPSNRSNLKVITSEKESIIKLRTSIFGGLNSSKDILATRLDLIKDEFDFVFIDCPPGVDVIQKNIVRAANAFIVPCVFGPLDRAGACRAIETIGRDLAEDGMPVTALADAVAVLPTRQTSSRTRMAVRAEAKKEFSELGIKVLETSIPESEAALKAFNYGVTAFEFLSGTRTSGERFKVIRPGNPVADAYAAIALELEFIKQPESVPA